MDINGGGIRSFWSVIFLLFLGYGIDGAHSFGAVEQIRFLCNDEHFIHSLVYTFLLSLVSLRHHLGLYIWSFCFVGNFRGIGASDLYILSSLLSFTST